ncbi:permease-like cell division protein FtsX [Microbispora sp. H10836]|uniref:permease-like cell division protein FtsX n=1 Tax=Microbispora sp. H10836 TaxID=2729106 RepID=UPI0014737E35|nr:permease-like cell division protein FtsX [Microbispora sp. H10836]
MEELSFGGDRREPESGASPFRKPLVIAGLAVVVLGGLAALGIAGWRFYEQSRWPLPPPGDPRPQTGSFSAYLCDRSSVEIWPNCHHRTATAGDKRAIEAELKTYPEIRDLSFVTKEQAWEEFRTHADESEGGPKLLSVLSADDMPESYRGTLGPGDWNALKRRLEALRGISNTYIFGDTSWQGIADIGIKLCPREGEAYKPCRGRAHASEREKAAVLSRVKDLDGVKAVYFEDIDHAIEDYRRILWNGQESDLDPRGLTETFYVTFDRPPARADMEKVFGRMPGVAEVVSVS